jgi:plasmid stabilization system protein ParE
MSYHYILHETAQEDYEVALRWYAERSLKATENFIIAVDDTLSLICDHPVRWRKINFTQKPKACNAIDT